MILKNVSQVHSPLTCSNFYFSFHSNIDIDHVGIDEYDMNGTERTNNEMSNNKKTKLYFTWRECNIIIKRSLNSLIKIQENSHGEYPFAYHKERKITIQCSLKILERSEEKK